MTTILDGEADDLASDVGPEQRRHPGRSFLVQLGDASFAFRPLTVADPLPTARQLLELAGLRPIEDHALFLLLPGGGLRSLRLGDGVDLRGPTQERFLAFRCHTLFRFILAGESCEWGERTIGAAILNRLAGIDPEHEAIWWERVEEPDHLLGEKDVIDLGRSGVERFRIEPIFWVCIEDRRTRWPRETITTEEIAQLGGWNAGEGVIEVDADQNERTLTPGEVVTLKPGIAFGKRLCWRRG